MQKGGNCCDFRFRFAFMHLMSLLKKESTLKTKKFLPSENNFKFFSFRVNHFSEGSKYMFSFFLSELTPLRLYQFRLRAACTPNTPIIKVLLKYSRLLISQTPRDQNHWFEITVI